MPVPQTATARKSAGRKVFLMDRGDVGRHAHFCTRIGAGDIARSRVIAALSRHSVGGGPTVKLSVVGDAPGHPVPPTDDVVGRVLGGETEAFAEIVRRHQRDVWKVAAAMLGDRVGTENLVQQTFINAYERLEQYERGRDMAQ